MLYVFFEHIGSKSLAWQYYETKVLKRNLVGDTIIPCVLCPTTTTCLLLDGERSWDVSIRDTDPAAAARAPAAIDPEDPGRELGVPEELGRRISSGPSTSSLGESCLSVDRGRDAPADDDGQADRWWYWPILLEVSSVVGGAGEPPSRVPVVGETRPAAAETAAGETMRVRIFLGEIVGGRDGGGGGVALAALPGAAICSSGGLSAACGGCLTSELGGLAGSLGWRLMRAAGDTGMWNIHIIHCSYFVYLYMYIRM